MILQNMDNKMTIFNHKISYSKILKRGLLPMLSKKIKSYWQQWLRINTHCFKYQPILLETLSHGFIYSFKGITKQITMMITFDTYCESMIYFDDMHGKNFDHKVLGYELINCSKNDLAHNVFEPLISFTNEYFSLDYRLYLVRYNGATEAYIGKKSLLIEEVHTVCSILE